MLIGLCSNCNIRIYILSANMICELLGNIPQEEYGGWWKTQTWRKDRRYQQLHWQSVHYGLREGPEKVNIKISIYAKSDDSIWYMHCLIKHVYLTFNIIQTPIDTELSNCNTYGHVCSVSGTINFFTIPPIIAVHVYEIKPWFNITSYCLSIGVCLISQGARNLQSNDKMYVCIQQWCDYLPERWVQKVWAPVQQP